MEHLALEKEIANCKAATSSLEMVISNISNMIINRRLNIGDRFPSERTLAKELNTSRNTVRSALRYYEAMGIVKTIRGSGSYLTEDSDALYRLVGMQQLVEKYNLFEMIEARRVLEIGIVRLAAERANRDNKIQLRKLCDMAIENSSGVISAERSKAYTQLDYQLHLEFAKIAGNSMLLGMFVAIKDTFMRAEEVWKMSNKDIKISSEAHERIVAAIIDNDPNRASLEMRKHLDNMEEMIKIAMSENHH